MTTYSGWARCQDGTRSSQHRNHHGWRQGLLLPVQGGGRWAQRDCGAGTGSHHEKVAELGCGATGTSHSGTLPLAPIPSPIVSSQDECLASQQAP